MTGSSRVVRTYRDDACTHIVERTSFHFDLFFTVVFEVRADYEFEHGRPAGALNVPAFFSTAQGMTVNPDFVDQARKRVFSTICATRRGAGGEKKRSADHGVVDFFPPSTPPPLVVPVRLFRRLFSTASFCLLQ